MSVSRRGSQPEIQTAVTEVIGHSSILITKRYSHATDSGRHMVVDLVDRADTKKTQSTKRVPDRYSGVVGSTG